MGGPSDETSNVNNLEDGGYLRFRFPHFTELVKSLIRDGYDGLVGFNGTEGVILGRNIQFCKDVVSGRFTNVWETNDTHSEGICGTTPKDFKFGSLFFFWWHVNMNNM